MTFTPRWDDLEMARSAIRDAIEAAARVDRSGWSAAARSAEPVEPLEAQERLDALIQRTTGEWDRDQCWAADDARPPVSWLGHRVPMTSTDAPLPPRTPPHLNPHDP